MLEKENVQLKDDLNQVKNQRELIDTLRREIQAVRNEQNELKGKCQEQRNEINLKNQLIERLKNNHEERIEK